MGMVGRSKEDIFFFYSERCSGTDYRKPLRRRQWQSLRPWAWHHLSRNSCSWLKIHWRSNEICLFTYSGNRKCQLPFMTTIHRNNIPIIINTESCNFYWVVLCYSMLCNLTDKLMKPSFLERVVVYLLCLSHIQGNVPWYQIRPYVLIDWCILPYTTPETRNIHHYWRFHPQCSNGISEISSTDI